MRTEKHLLKDRVHNSAQQYQYDQNCHGAEVETAKTRQAAADGSKNWLSDLVHEGVDCDYYGIGPPTTDLYDEGEDDPGKYGDCEKG